MKAVSSSAGIASNARLRIRRSIGSCRKAKANWSVIESPG